MNDLEQQLARQKFKPVPPEWRAAILRATTPEPCASDELASSWWQAWFWGWPRAWASLAALWALILLGQLTMPSVHSPQTATTMAYGASAAEAWREQQQLLAELFPQERHAEPPKALPPRRRGERKQDFYFA
jgi:hypothetical protein